MNKLVHFFGEKYFSQALIEQRGNKLEMKYFNLDVFLENIFDYPPEESINNLLKIIKKEEKSISTDNEVRIVIPDSETYFQLINMPLLTEKELATAIRYQAEQFIPLPIDETCLDMEVINVDKANNITKNFIVAASRKLVDKIININEKLGFLPISLENETSALFKFLSSFNIYEQIDINDQFILIINFGYKNTTLILYNLKLNIPEEITIYQNGLNLFLKEITVNITNNIAKSFIILNELDYSNDEYKEIKSLISYSLDYFLKEISRLLNYYENKYSIKISNAFSFGEGSNLMFLKQKFIDNSKISLQDFSFSNRLIEKTESLNKIKNNQLFSRLPLFGAALT